MTLCSLPKDRSAQSECYMKGASAGGEDKQMSSACSKLMDVLSYDRSKKVMKRDNNIQENNNKNYILLKFLTRHILLKFQKYILLKLLHEQNTI